MNNQTENEEELKPQTEELQQENYEEAEYNITLTKKKFSATIIAKIAMFTALAFALSYIEFPIFPATPFLKIDFGNVFIMLSGFMFGPLGAIITLLCKEFLCFITKSSTGGVGEIANVIMTLSYIIVPSCMYLKKKGKKWVIITMCIGVLLQACSSLLVNRFINFPLYMGEGAGLFFAQTWYYIFLFNLIKGVAISVLTFILYKKISYLLKKF